MKSIGYVNAKNVGGIKEASTSLVFKDIKRLGCWKRLCIFV